MNKLLHQFSNMQFMQPLNRQGVVGFVQFTHMMMFGNQKGQTSKIFGFIVGSL